jgi:hypothetical protein
MLGCFITGQNAQRATPWICRLEIFSRGLLPCKIGLGFSTVVHEWTID